MWPPDTPVPPKSLVEAELDAMSRNPFRRLTAKHVQAAMNVPEDRLAEFAAKSPDRMAQSIAIYARGAGYTDKLELSASDGTLVALRELSDAAVRVAYLRAIRAGTAALAGADADAPEDGALGAKETDA